MISMNSTTANVSWIVRDVNITIYSYTVIYSEDSQQSATFSSSATYCVITDLNTSTVYNISVFATFTVDGQMLEGERSSTVTYCELFYTSTFCV